ncbi:MAG: family 16 glycosylhydrolase, partial [Fidelibacterota bacterium]
MIFSLLPGLLWAGDLYRGAELRTHDSYKYGRFEVHYKAAGSSGITSTFFTYYDGPDSYSRWNELDIEIMGRYTQDIQFNTITPGQVNHVSHYQLSFNPYNAFHTYAIEWTPDYVAWFVDGIMTYKQTDEHIQTLVESQKIMMNIWQPAYTGWSGDFDERQLPLFAEYDWVQYSSYTPGSGNTGTDNNFTFQWRDDFNFFDSNRWGKASHTWNGNNCLFIPENVVYHDGKMILCMTDNTNTGYTDKTAPAILWAKGLGKKVSICYSEPVDSTTALISGSYNVSGTTFSSIQYGSDSRIVLLNLNNEVDFNNVSLFALGIQDTPPGNNTLDIQVVHITETGEHMFPLKINVGGNAWNDWVAGSVYSHTVSHGYEEGSSGYFPGQAIANTDDDEIFRSEIFGLTAYKIHVPNGLYDVILLFTENYFSEVDKRQFDVQIEGACVIDNLDIFAEAGKHSALMKTIENIPIQDQQLDIWFSDIQKDLPLLNGIMIVQKSSTIH